MTIEIEHELWTIQLSKWRVAKALEIPLLDITAKTGLAAFAPDFQDVMSYKRGEMDADEYTRIYKLRMEQSKLKYPVRWASLLTKPKLALACYCAAGRFCHRHLCAEIFRDYLNSFEHRVHLRGELLSVS